MSSSSHADYYAAASRCAEAREQVEAASQRRAAATFNAETVGMSPCSIALKPGARARRQPLPHPTYQLTD